MSSTDLEDFKGTARYRLEERLGGGAHGIAFKATDQEQNRVVAIKVLNPVNADLLVHFRDHFPALAGLSHPNLVQLYEFSDENEPWFFTMEMVEGVDFLEYVKDPDFAQLRAATGQLASAVHALHAKGLVHRNIKPSNIRVDGQGRVVLMDACLAADPRSFGAGQSLNVTGSGVYSSPELTMGRAITPATDWYSLGVILYQALTGRPPFAGDFYEMLIAKQRAGQAPPSDRVPGLPLDLDALCQDLLHPDPADRPSGEEVIHRLK